jgi:hypothetical protein
MNDSFVQQLLNLVVSERKLPEDLAAVLPNAWR